MRIDLLVIVTADDGQQHTAKSAYEDDPEDSEWDHDIRLAKLAVEIGADVTHVVRDLMDHPHHPEQPPEVGDRDYLN